MKKAPFSDIDLDNWQEYGHIETGSLWLFERRGDAPQEIMHGCFIPQVAGQLIERYSKAGEVVLDMFLGSGTTAFECLRLGRHCIGVDLASERGGAVHDALAGMLKPDDPHFDIIWEDSTSQRAHDMIKMILVRRGVDFAHLVILHPPYHDIIKFSDDPRDLSNAPDLQTFLDSMCRVMTTARDLLAPGRFCALVIGDAYKDGELVPLSFHLMMLAMGLGFKPKAVIVKDINGNETGKGKSANLWRYRALAGGFCVFKHEYVMVFQKP